MRPNTNPINFGTVGTPALTLIGNVTKGSVAFWATDILRCSVQIGTTGTLNGTIQLRVSNDIAVGLPKNQYQPANWSLIGTAVTVTTAGVYLIPYIETSYEYIQLLYTDSSGGTSTGVIAQANFCSKGL